MGLPLRFIFLIDWVSTLFITCVLIIYCLVMYYCKIYIGEEIILRFLGLVFVFVLSIFILILGGNIFTIIVGWDGLGLSSFCLVIFYQNNSSLRSGLITIYRNRVGDVFLLISLFFFFCSFNWSLDRKISNIFIALILFLGAITKRAQAPFSAWLPAAIAAPTPVRSLVHSSTLVTAGIYLIIRFYRALGPIKFWVLPLSLITILLAGLVACVESDLKKIIAMSTLSQLGVILFSLNIINWKLAFFHILTHAMFKSMLFLGGGNMIIINWGDQNSHTYGGIYSPSLGVFNIIGSLSLIGFPFLSGFYSKDIIIELSFLRGNTLTVCVFLFRCIITVLYSLRFIAVGFFLYSNNFNTFNYNIPYNIIIPIFFFMFLGFNWRSSHHMSYYRRVFLFYVPRKINRDNNFNFRVFIFLCSSVSRT